MRGVRVPDPLWERVEKWAAGRGQGTSDALRLLLEQAVENIPSDGVIVRPPMRWMTAERRHSCFRAPDGLCGAEWVHHPGDWVFVKIIETGLTFDDLFSSVVSQGPVLHRRLWYRVLSRDLPDIALAFQGNEDKLRVHHLMVEEGPCLVRADGDR